ncbi:MAG: ATP-dependent metallopeptidase FtsH/Yme1/Tma family protein, partial [Oceanococcaceae bacterium]
MNDLAKNMLLWVVIAVVLMSVFSSFSQTRGASESIAYSQFLDQVKNGNVRQVAIEGQQILGESSGGMRFTTYSPESDNTAMIGTLLDNNVQIVGRPPRGQPLLLQ